MTTGQAHFHIPDDEPGKRYAAYIYARRVFILCASYDIGTGFWYPEHLHEQKADDVLVPLVTMPGMSCDTLADAMAEAVRELVEIVDAQADG